MLENVLPDWKEKIEKIAEKKEKEEVKDRVKKKQWKK